MGLVDFFQFSTEVPKIEQFETCLKLTTEQFRKTQIGSHHLNEDFKVRGKEPKDEVQIYTWKDATLRELTDLVIPTSPLNIFAFYLLCPCQTCLYSFYYLLVNLNMLGSFFIGDSC